MATAARRKGSWLKPQPVRDWQTYYREIWKPNMTTATKPTEAMTLPAFQAARQALRDAVRTFDIVAANCKSCKNFSTGACTLHGDVPAEFQAQIEACPDWQYDAIPF